MWELRESLGAKREAAFSRYRSSGFGLMASVITLSAGGVAAAMGTDRGQPWMAGVLMLPIWSGLIQQLLHFMGERHAAHAAHHTERVSSIFSPSFLNPHPENELERLMEAANAESREWSTHWLRSEVFFEWADCFCAATVAAFLIVSTACVYAASNKPQPGNAIATSTPAADAKAPPLPSSRP